MEDRNTPPLKAGDTVYLYNDSTGYFKKQGIKSDDILTVEDVEWSDIENLWMCDVYNSKERKTVFGIYCYRFKSSRVSNEERIAERRKQLENG